MDRLTPTQVVERLFEQTMTLNVFLFVCLGGINKTIQNICGGCVLVDCFIFLNGLFIVHIGLLDRNLVQTCYFISVSFYAFYSFSSLHLLPIGPIPTPHSRLPLRHSAFRTKSLWFRYVDWRPAARPGYTIDKEKRWNEDQVSAYLRYRICVLFEKRSCVKSDVGAKESLWNNAEKRCEFRVKPRQTKGHKNSQKRNQTAGSS